jgi:hypothetical protein
LRINLLGLRSANRYFPSQQPSPKLLASLPGDGPSDHNKERLAALKVSFYSQLLKFYTHNIHTTHQILLSFFLTSIYFYIFLPVDCKKKFEGSLAKHRKQPLSNSNIEAQRVHDDERQHGFNFFNNNTDDALQKVRQQLSDALAKACFICFILSFFNFLCY